MLVKDFMKVHENDAVEINCHEEFNGCLEFTAWNTNQDYDMFVKNYGDMIIKESHVETRFRKCPGGVFSDMSSGINWHVLEVGYNN